MPTPTIQFYNDHAADFVANTLHADMSSLYAPFLALLPPGARILDAGCGSGRDSLYFQQHGYAVTAFDAAEEMVGHAAALTGLPVLRKTFAEIDFDAAFDGVWACASLLHVPRAALDDAIARLARALAPGGIFYLSFKYGDGERFTDGRNFTFCTEATFATMLAAHPALAPLQVWKTADVRPGRENYAWLNALVKKDSA